MLSTLLLLLPIFVTAAFIRVVRQAHIDFKPKPLAMLRAMRGITVIRRSG
jgi:hypothetical protein